MNDRKKMISAPIIHYCIHIKIVTIIENNQQLPLPNFAVSAIFDEKCQRQQNMGSLIPKSFF